ncbi:hypothetical protein K7X08_030459 [Anisodus acutangulus]|uniref:Uncharacterized protein n=1 Tax=Anisodus acutangulus TaxID=402998 RepID=A0A9Q1L5P8_9SOLA|nr:hypothetical protein K7X08_030459 [Anisodus acutangulus]
MLESKMEIIMMQQEVRVSTEDLLREEDGNGAEDETVAGADYEEGNGVEDESVAAAADDDEGNEVEEAYNSPPVVEASESEGDAEATDLAKAKRAKMRRVVEDSDEES